MRRAFRTQRPLGLAASAIAASLLLASCGGGGGSNHSTSAPAVKDAAKNATPISTSGLPSAPGAVVARVGPYAVSQAAYNHLLTSEVMAEPPAGRVVPAPPEFTACIAHLRATASAAATQAMLREGCQKKYEALHEKVLNTLITDEWLIGAAKELKVKISEAEVQKNIAEFERHSFPTKAKLEAYMAHNGLTIDDLIFQTRVEFSSAGIRREIKRKVGPFPNSRLIAYYNAHKDHYVVPETRDLQIAHVKKKSEALKIKREIASGKSFASVVKGLSLRQPIYSAEGLVKGLKSGAYNEPILNDAIFKARPKKLIGPVNVIGPAVIAQGYYILEVKKIHPRRQKSYAELKAKLQREAPEKLQAQAFTNYVAQWRRRWRARTICPPGYVVRKCKEFKVSSSTPAEDPNTLG